MAETSFESIIPTALHTAYPLIYTDIPYAKEIYEALCEYGFPEELKNDKLCFELEARYVLIDKFLEESKITQVLEIACGFTSRGLNFCKENAGFVYVELDLPKVIEEKKAILNKVAGGVTNNLYFVEGNALNRNDINKCLKHFDLSKPIAIINQGLMRYLNFDEKRFLTKIVYDIIAKNNGIWLTCDFTPAKFLVTEDKNLTGKEDYNKKLTQVTDRNNAAWRFKDKRAVEQFLKTENLKIEWHDFVEALPMLSSKNNLDLKDNEVEKYLQNAYVGVITARQNPKLTIKRFD